MKLKVALLVTAMSVAAFTTANAEVVTAPALDSVSVTIGDSGFEKIFTKEVPGRRSCSALLLSKICHPVFGPARFS